jgi:chemotaxis response regulator CheB
MALEALLPSLTEVKVVQVAGDRAEALEFVRLYRPTLAIVVWVDDQMASGDAIGVACLLSVVEPGP